MHQPVKDRLEEYLRRNGSEGFEEVTAHLGACPECRQAVAAMEQQSQMLRNAFRVQRQVAPAVGFYARVSTHIDNQRKPSLWSVFLEPQFGRRLFYSTLTLLLLLSTYMISTEPGEEQIVTAAAETLVDNDATATLGTDQDRDRDIVLVHLTSFSE